MDSLEGDSSDMFVNMITYNKNISDFAVEQLRRQILAYQTPYFEKLITGGEFDIIVLEGNAVLPFASKLGMLREFKVPCVILSPIPIVL